MGERDYKGKGIERGIGIGIYIHPLFLLSSHSLFILLQNVYISALTKVCALFSPYSETYWHSYNY